MHIFHMQPLIQRSTFCREPSLDFFFLCTFSNCPQIKLPWHSSSWKYREGSSTPAVLSQSPEEKKYQLQHLSSCSPKFQLNLNSLTTSGHRTILWKHYSLLTYLWAFLQQQTKLELSQQNQMTNFSFICCTCNKNFKAVKLERYSPYNIHLKSLSSTPKNTAFLDL